MGGRIITIMILCIALLCEGRGEVEVLMEMKDALDPKGEILYSWVKGGDPCSGNFDGVACNEHGKVANVSLQGKGLSGSIPSAVGKLECLTGLYLHYNNLQGKIPIELSNLTELLDLYLNVNMLSGPVPNELGAMSSLQGFKQLQEGFRYGNNSKLCGEEFAGLAICNASYPLIRPEPLGSRTPNITTKRPGDSTVPPLQKIPESTDLSRICQNCSKTFKTPSIAIVVGVIALICGGIMASVFTFSWFRGRKPKISSAYETIDSRLSIDNSKDFGRKSIAPLISLEYSSGWNPLADEGT